MLIKRILDSSARYMNFSRHEDSHMILYNIHSHQLNRFNEKRKSALLILFLSDVCLILVRVIQLKDGILELNHNCKNNIGSTTVII